MCRLIPSSPYSFHQGYDERLHSATSHRGGGDWISAYLTTIRGLETGVVGRGWEARTCLGDVRQFTVAYDVGVGILCGQFLEQSEHGSLLGLSPGVVWTTFLIETTFVADAE